MPPRSRGVISPGCAFRWPSIKREGAGKAGPRLRPVAPVRKNARGRNHRYSRTDPASPARWASRLCRALPGVRLFSHRRLRGSSSPKDLTPASGRQDHAISRPRRIMLVQHHRHGHRSPPPRIVTTRTPLCTRRDGSRQSHVLIKRKKNIFRGRTGQPKSD